MSDLKSFEESDLKLVAFKTLDAYMSSFHEGLFKTNFSLLGRNQDGETAGVSLYHPCLNTLGKDHSWIQLYYIPPAEALIDQDVTPFMGLESCVKKSFTLLGLFEIQNRIFGRRTLMVEPFTLDQVESFLQTLLGTYDVIGLSGSYI